MAAGLRGLRQAMWFNAGADFAGLGRTPEALKDIARIEAAWAEALAAHGGPFLFGARFGMADAMYAPVVGRFLTWQPVLSATTEIYTSLFVGSVKMCIRDSNVRCRSAPTFDEKWFV